MAEIRQLQQQAAGKYELVKDVDKANGFGPRLTKASTRLDAAKRLVRLEQYDNAKKILVEVTAELDAIKTEAAGRLTANNAKQAAKKARTDAKAARADVLAAQAWADSEDNYLNAEDAFNAGKFAEAVTAFKKSADGFTEARDSVLIIGVARKAEDEFKKRLTQNYTRSQLSKAAGDVLKKVDELAKDAAAAMRSANYKSATSKYKQATSMVPQIEGALRKTLGVKYWAYNIGRISTEIMFQGVLINLVAMGRLHRHLDGQVFALFLLVIAAVEAGLALGLVVLLYRRKHSLDSESWSVMRG